MIYFFSYLMYQKEKRRNLILDCYLVDFENVHANGIKRLLNVSERDTVIIFFSEQSKNITLDVIEEVTKNNAILTCHKVNIGTKNALDFQLSSHLGYLIGKDVNDTKYHIVSQDKGYDCLCDYWRKQGINVDRIGTTEPVSAPTFKKKSKTKTSNLATFKEIKKYLSNEDDPGEILTIFNQHKTKQEICNGIAKKFKDNKRTSAVYKKIKPLLKEKNKM